MRLCKIFSPSTLLLTISFSGIFGQTISAPDDLITQLSVKSGRPYTVHKLQTGVKQVIDRNYIITMVPNYLQGASFIQTANSDKLNATSDFLSFFVSTDAVVYIAYDPRGTILPAWLNGNGWTNTGDSLGTSDPKVGYLTIYSKAIQNEERFYPVVLGGNLATPAGGAKTNYLVAAVKRPAVQQLQAEDALLSGAVVANNHGGYNGTGFVDFKNPADGYIEWPVKIHVPGTYKLDFNFTNAGSKSRVLRITDNGADVGTRAFNPVSASWSDWTFFTGATIFLSQGMHNIRLSATGTSGPNIDELYLYYISAVPPFTTVNYLAKTVIRHSNPVQTHRAYPNPFFESTNICYSLKEKARVNLSVYTLQGERVQVLENKVREAGNYRVNFSAGKLPKGAYLYKLQTGNDCIAGKIIKN